MKIYKFNVSQRPGRQISDTSPGIFRNTLLQSCAKCNQKKTMNGHITGGQSHLALIKTTVCSVLIALKWS